MARSRHTKHLVGKVTKLPHEGREGETDSWNVESLCGEKYSGTRVFRDPARETPYSYASFPWSHDVCPKCSAKHWEAALKAEPNGFEFGDRIDLSIGHGPENPTRPSGMSSYLKSAYPVIRTGTDEIVAFVCIDSGWGKSWEIRGWDTPNRWYNEIDREMTPVLGSDDTQWVREGEPDSPYESLRKDTKFSAKNLSSRFYALSLIPNMLKHETIRTYSQCVQADNDTVQRLRTDNLQRENERKAAARREQDRLDVLTADRAQVEEVLRSIIEDTTLLTNWQRDGIFMAAKLLHMDLTTPPPFKLDGAEPAAKPETPMAIQSDDISDDGNADLVLTDDWGEVIG